MGLRVTRRKGRCNCSELLKMPRMKKKSLFLTEIGVSVICIFVLIFEKGMRLFPLQILTKTEQKQ